ncbi:3,4-dihydroxy-2-butanone-4-phosphate synthase [Alphaproteobacteria bacterium HT1-32]|nr:3,4-dihydroxy-2-butanone-4-phosphate synthase [Alphaproteobacteria bacterium HT1-32]
MLRAFPKWRPDVQYRRYLSSPEEIIEDFRNGRMCIIVDDEERENEGDLVIPAQMATPDAINFMAKHGRGLICLALTPQRVEQLALPLMSADNASRHQTAFTVSIEAREGVTTGISASDRAHTIAVAIDPSKQRADLATPGHVFPLMAREGGVLMRAGHTEAAVDLARLAGLNPSGVICEIMNDDGTMARMPDLVGVAQHHNLKIGAIADLIAYRRKNDSLVKRSLETSINTTYAGDFKLYVYVNTVSYAEHLALVKGDIEPSDEPLLVRMHALSVLDDVLGDTTAGKNGELHSAMKAIDKAGRGVVVIIRESQPTSLTDRIKARIGSASGNSRPAASNELRDYGVGAQILLDLGVRDMTLLSNTERTIIGLEGYGLQVRDRMPIGKQE